MQSKVACTDSSSSCPTVWHRRRPTSAVGADVGAAVVGDDVGCAVGDALGAAVGALVGAIVGAALGAAVGLPVGCAEGAAVGLTDGVAVGEADGLAVGTAVGLAVGPAVGAAVGAAVGDAVGAAVGAADGAAVGLVVGAWESQNTKPSGQSSVLPTCVVQTVAESTDWQCPAVPTHPVQRSKPAVTGQFRNPAGQVCVAGVSYAAQKPTRSLMHGPVPEEQVVHSVIAGAAVGAAVGAEVAPALHVKLVNSSGNTATPRYMRVALMTSRRSAALTLPPPSISSCVHSARKPNPLLDEVGSRDRSCESVYGTITLCELNSHARYFMLPIPEWPAVPQCLAK